MVNYACAFSQSELGKNFEYNKNVIYWIARPIKDLLITRNFYSRVYGLNNTVKHCLFSMRAGHISRVRVVVALR